PPEQRTASSSVPLTKAALSNLHQFQELSEASFLVTFQVPGLSEHSFGHAGRQIPMSVHARSQELFAGSSSRTVRGDNISDDRCKHINDLHENLTPGAFQRRHTPPTRSHRFLGRSRPTTNINA